ncbi:MAG: hypothetical protein H0U75_13620 [Legionella sp.]|nr:hypothetical protein [Legionella sp.]
MLIQLRDFIYDGGLVSTQQLTREFHIDDSALQPMLDLLIHKGMIIKIGEPNSDCQTSCFKCRKSTNEYYSKHNAS